MLTFVFWNLRGLNLTPALRRLVRLHSVDALILAEATAPELNPSAFLPVLNAGEAKPFNYSPDRCIRIEIYTRFPPDLLRPTTEEARYTVRRVALPDRPDFFLAAAHLISKAEQSPASQYDQALELCLDIRSQEARAGHRRTVVVGDLNMNPFEYGMISASRFNAVSSKEIARQETRRIQRRDYPFFYNPTWRFFGDRVGSPPGTYYYRKADEECYFWNIFDQVLVRPALLEYWDDSDIQILTGDGKSEFLSPGKRLPGGVGKSDHLPILFRLRL